MIRIISSSWWTFEHKNRDRQGAAFSAGNKRAVMLAYLIAIGIL